MLKNTETGKKQSGALQHREGYRAPSPFDELDRLMANE